MKDIFALMSRRSVVVVLTVSLCAAVLVDWGIRQLSADGPPSASATSESGRGSPLPGSQIRRKATQGTYFTGDRLAQRAVSSPDVETKMADGFLAVTLSGPAERRLAAVAMPYSAQDEKKPMLVSLRVELPKAGASGTGVFCRGRTSGSSLDDGYALIVRRSGSWTLGRIRGNQFDQLRRGTVRPERLQPGRQPALVQLSCEQRRPDADLAFAVRLADGKPVMFSVSSGTPAVASAPAGRDVGLVVLHVAPKGGVTEVRSDLAAVHELPGASKFWPALRAKPRGY